MAPGIGLQEIIMNKKLGNTDLVVCPVSLGTALLGVNMNDKQVDTLLGTYFEEGGNFIDTAHVYSDWIPGERCLSEKSLGKWLKRRKSRHDLVLGTKGAHPDVAVLDSQAPQDRMALPELRKDLEESLSYLNTDYIDMYWLHRDNTNYSVEEILCYLELFVKEGKIRYYGCSNWSLARVEEARSLSDKMDWQGFSANQIEWSCALKNPQSLGDYSMKRMDKAFYEYHNSHNWPNLSYGSQAQGLYGKVYQNGWQGLSKSDIKTYGLPVNREIYALIKEYSKESHFSVDQLVLSYHFSPQNNSLPIIGSTNPNRIRNYMRSLDVRLDEEVVSHINNLLLREK